MPDTPTIIYWDSSAFLSYVNEHPDRISTLEALLESSANGTIELYTSTISHVEVAFGASEQQRRRLDPEIERKSILFGLIRRLLYPLSTTDALVKSLET